MSFDITVFDPAGVSRADFPEWFERMRVECASQGPTPRLAGFLDELRTDFRSYEQAPDELADGAHFADADCAGPTAYLSCSWSAAAEFESAVHRLAVAHGVGFEDVSTTRGAVWFPPAEERSHGAHLELTLTVEGQSLYAAPSGALLAAATEWLGSGRPPSFLIVEAADGSYVQSMGGEAGLTAECRLMAPPSIGAGPVTFWHGVAATDSDASDELVELEGNGGSLSVLAGEVLTVADVQMIVGDFAAGLGASPAFSWHDITAQFTDAS